MRIYFDASTIGHNGNIDREPTRIKVVSSDTQPLLSQLELAPYFQEPYGIRDFDENSGVATLKEGLTNNHGELLALYLAMIVATQKDVKEVCGDSNNAIQFWSKGQYNAKSIKNEETIALIKIVTDERNKFEAKGGQVIKISGDKNPADLGYHK